MVVRSSRRRRRASIRKACYLMSKRQSEKIYRSFRPVPSAMLPAPNSRPSNSLLPPSPTSPPQSRRNLTPLASQRSSTRHPVQPPTTRSPSATRKMRRRKTVRSTDAAPLFIESWVGEPILIEITSSWGRDP